MSLRVVSELTAHATQRLVDIVDEPLSFPAEARPVRATGRKTIWRVSLHGRKLFLKVYRARPGLGALKEAVRRSAGMQLWDITGQLERAGIPTARRLAAGDRRYGLRMLEWTFFACEDVEDAVPLAQLVADARGWEPGRRRAFGARLAKRFAALDALRFFQPDLKPTNFLVRGDAASGGEFSLLPIDLRQCRVGSWPPGAATRTTRQLRERVLEGWPQEDVEAFFEAWQERSRR